MDKICFSPGTFTLLFIAVITSFVVMYIYQRDDLNQAKLYIPAIIPNQQQSQISSSPKIQEKIIPTQTVIITDQIDTSQGPERKYISMNDTTLYHELGYIQGTVHLHIRMKLYGRRKYPRSDKFEYYIVDNNNIKISVRSKNDKELYENDIIQITGFTEPFTVHLYDVQGPRYQAIV